MPTPPAVTRNAADPKAVRTAERLEQQRAERFERALLAVMRTGEGRIVMGELIRSAGVNKSVLARDVTIHHLAAVQNFGLEWSAKLWAIDDGLSFQLMEREHRQWVKAFEASVRSATHPRALTMEQDGNGSRDDSSTG